MYPSLANELALKRLRRLLNSAASRCPNSILLAGGYRYFAHSHLSIHQLTCFPLSQGAALCHRAIENLSTSVKNRIAAVVTYGDTRNEQDNGQIPNFPRDKVKVICNVGDAVCSGSLTILAPHLDYVRRVPEALTFYNQKVAAFGA